METEPETGERPLMSTPNNTDGTAGAGGPRRRFRGLVFQLAALGLVVASALAGTGLARLLRGPEAPTKDSAFGLQMPARLDATFRTWESADDTGKRPPDLVLLLSGQQHGYLLPCGCSKPQIGGLERRYNFERLLKQRGWKVVAVDVGDVAQKEGIAGPVRLPNVQGMLKYTTAMRSLKAMGYSAVAIGEHEAFLTLADTLGNFALNEDRPSVLAANLKDANANFPGIKEWSEAAEVDAAKGGLPFKVGVAAIDGKSTQQRILKLREPNVAFEDSTPALIRTFRKMAEAGMELRVLLYQGLVNGGRPGQPPTEGVACATYCQGQIHVLLCASEEDEPPGQPEWVTHATGLKTPVITLGHKTKYIGVLGVWRTGNAAAPFAFKYQLVELTPDYATPDGHEKDHPILEEMERYTTTLQKENYLARYAQTKHILQVMPPVKGIDGIPTYVGSRTCKKCHSAAYAIWEKSDHGHAYHTLVAEAKHPSNRQFDGECIVCHTVGFGYDGGYHDEVKTPLLKDVGCENCHGPGSLHVAHPNNEEWRKRMNLAWWHDPDKKETKEQTVRRMAVIDQFCQKCHDIDNDVTWKNSIPKPGEKPVFERKWDKVKHYNDGQ
jgi:hypothetical protein